MSAIGEAALIEAGVTPEELESGSGFHLDAFGIGVSDAVRMDCVEAVAACVDGRAYMIGRYVENYGVSEDAAACLEEHLDDETARDFLVARLAPGNDVSDETYARLSEPYARCPAAASTG